MNKDRGKFSPSIGLPFSFDMGPGVFDILGAPGNRD
jgi:hypothetical protein